MGFFKDLKEDLSQAVTELMPDEEIIGEELFEEESASEPENAGELKTQASGSGKEEEPEDVKLGLSNWMKKLEEEEKPLEQGIGSLFADAMDEETEAEEPEEESLEAAFKKAMSGLSGDDDGNGLNLFGSQELFEEPEEPEELELPIPDINEVHEELPEIAKEPELQQEPSVSEVVSQELSVDAERQQEEEIHLEVDDIPTPEELLAQWKEEGNEDGQTGELEEEPVAEEPDAELAGEAIDEAIDEAIEKLADVQELLEEPEPELLEEFVEEPVADEPVAELADAQVEQLADVSVAKLSDALEAEPVAEAADEPAAELPDAMEEEMQDQFVEESADEIKTEPKAEPVADLADKPVAEPDASESYLDALLQQMASPQESVFEKELEKESNTDEVKEMADSNVTVITKGTKIDGSISADGSLEVYGVITGDVCCDGKLAIHGTVSGNSTAEEIFVNTATKFKGNLTSDGAVKIGAETVVIGDVTGTSAVIAGAVKGEVDINGPVVLDSTAVIKGNINAKTVQINSGAIVDGYCSLSYSNIDVNDIFEQEGETPNA